MSKTKTLYGFASEQKAITGMWTELNNWTWVNNTVRQKIANGATIKKYNSRFGFVFQITFEIV